MSILFEIVRLVLFLFCGIGFFYSYLIVPNIIDVLFYGILMIFIKIELAK